MGAPGGMNQQEQNQPVGPDNGEAFEAGESEGPEDDGPEEMDAGGFEVPEPIEDSGGVDTPDTSEPSDFAATESEELRRDKPDSDDDLQ